MPTSVPLLDARQWAYIAHEAMHARAGEWTKPIGEYLAAERLHEVAQASPSWSHGRKVELGPIAHASPPRTPYPTHKSTRSQGPT